MGGCLSDKDDRIRDSFQYLIASYNSIDNALEIELRWNASGGLGTRSQSLGSAPGSNTLQAVRATRAR